MIDLDKAQLDAAAEKGWDPAFRVDGCVVLMLPPSRVRESDVRKGLVPAALAVIARLWRVVMGGSEIAALRREVASNTDPTDPASRRAVQSLGAHHLGLLVAAWTSQAGEYNRRVVAAALAAKAANQQSSKAANQGGDYGGVKGLSTGVQPAPGGRSFSVELRPGGGRLPGAILGGAMWGKAALDAEAAAKARDTNNTNSGDTNG